MTRKIHIITPSYDGKVHCDYSIALCEVFRVVASIPGLSLHLNYWMHEALIQKARNNLFCDAYEAGATDIVFIDADQSFTVDTFMRMIAHPVDVVGVPVRMKTQEERYNIRPEDPTLHRQVPDLQLLEVDVIGTGMLRISRDAAKVLYDNAPAYMDGDRERRMICNVQIVDGGIISEDVQMCDRLREAGFKIYVDPFSTVDHFGTMKYTGSYVDYYVSRVQNVPD